MSKLDERYSEIEDRAFAEAFRGLPPIWAELSKIFRHAVLDQGTGVHGSLHDSFARFTLNKVYFASEFLKAYKPDWRSFLDFDRITLCGNEKTERNLTRSIADFVYRVPLLSEPKAFAALKLIAEHKAQNSFLDNKRTAGNLLKYMVLETLSEDNYKTKVSPQALAVLLYTGSDPNYVAPRWQDYFPVPAGCEDLAIRCDVPCVNLTKCFLEGNLPGAPIVQAVTTAFSLAALKKFDTDYMALAEPLAKVTNWDHEDVRQLGGALSLYVSYASNMAGQLVDSAKFNRIVKTVVSERMRWEMNSCYGGVVFASEVSARAEERRETLIRVICDWLVEDYEVESRALRDRIGEIRDSDLLDKILRALRRTRDYDSFAEKVEELFASNPDAVSNDRWV